MHAWFLGKYRADLLPSARAAFDDINPWQSRDIARQFGAAWFREVCA
jgi:hypothetical protein